MVKFYFLSFPGGNQIPRQQLLDVGFVAIAVGFLFHRTQIAV